MKMRTLTAAMLALLSMQSVHALAQTPPGVAASPDMQAQAQAQTQADPPGRVARLNYTAGTVTTEPAGASDWAYAQINRPLTTGDQLWNDQNARSELHIGSTALRLGSSTSLAVLALDDAHAQLKVSQGTLSMRVRENAPGSGYEIDTPNAAFTVTQPADMRVDVAPDGHATTVTVRSGGVVAYGDGGSLQLSPGQQITFEGTNLQQAAANAAPAPDAFDQWTASRDAAEDRSVSARYVSRDIPGYQDLDANGTWRNDPTYGAIWTPTAVSADWAPYREGHWVWQAPWGWTWIDDAPWGFAPYHYGRWAYVGSQWAWVPGPMVASAPPPAYAPALVGFVGDGGGGVDWNVALTVGGVAAAGVAWFALGPGEPWHPHHDGWSPRYYEQVNRNVYNDRSVHINNTYVNYRAPRGLTAMPASGFVRGQAAGHQPVSVDPSRWRNPRFLAGAPAIAPTRDSYAPGVRRTDYRPPQGGFGRPVVATRAPVMFQGRDSGAKVPRGFNDVHVVATHGPARAVITPHEGAPHPGVANVQEAPRPVGNGVPHPGVASVQEAPRPVGNGGPRPGIASVQPAPQASGNGVPHPPQNAQQAGAGQPRVYRGDEVSQGHEPRAPQQAFQHPHAAQPTANAPRIERGAPPMQAAQQPHIQQHAAPNMPMQAHEAPQPHINNEHGPMPQPHAQEFHPQHMEAPHQPAPAPMHAQAPQPQIHQEPPHQQPHPEQAQQSHGGGERPHG